MSNENLNDLFAGSGLGDDAVKTLSGMVDNLNLGPAIMAGLGDVTVDALDALGASEVFALTLVVDDSYSIQTGGNTDLVIEGHNLVIDSLKGSVSAGAVLVSCTLLNKGVLYPFVPLEQATYMSRDNYRPNGGTPLYDTMAVALASVVAKMTELENGGVAVRGATYAVSDGADLHSRMYPQPEKLEPIVTSLLRTESHIVGGMGIDDGFTDFRDIFRRMGIPSQWHLTPGNTPAEIREGFGTMSRSAARASQAAGAFSQTAMGGFGN